MGCWRDISVLSPGERIKNWMEALAAVWPIVLFLLGGAVYGNSDTVRAWIHGPDEIAPVEQSYNEVFNKINQKFLEQDERMDKLEKRDSVDQYKLQKQIDEIQELVN